MVQLQPQSLKKAYRDTAHKTIGTLPEFCLHSWRKYILLQVYVSLLSQRMKPTAYGSHQLVRGKKHAPGVLLPHFGCHRATTHYLLDCPDAVLFL